MAIKELNIFPLIVSLTAIKELNIFPLIVSLTAIKELTVFCLNEVLLHATLLVMWSFFTW